MIITKLTRDSDCHQLQEKSNKFLVEIGLCEITNVHKKFEINVFSEEVKYNHFYWSNFRKFRLPHFFQDSLAQRNDL